MKKKVFIIENDALAALRITNLIKEVPEFLLLGNLSNGKEALEAIQSHRPDVLFLGEALDDCNGFDLVQYILPKNNPAIKCSPLIIFITQHIEFALKAFDLFAFDFLIKPYKDDRFYKSAKKIITHLNQDHPCPLAASITNSRTMSSQNNSTSRTQHPCAKLPVKLGNRIAFIKTDHIKYIKASGYYAEIYTDDRTYLLRKSLSNLVHALNPSLFFRIHRSTIINISNISELISSNYGEVDVKMEDQKLFRISKSYKKKFMVAIGL